MQAEVEDPVHHKEEQAEDENRHKHYRRGCLHFLARGSYHLAHLPADIAQKVREFPPRRGRLVYQVRLRIRPLPLGQRRLFLTRPVVSVYECCFGCHASMSFASGVLPAATQLNLAGAEGFEPPSSVLETDSLTVELTPLKTGTRDQGTGNRIASPSACYSLVPSPCSLS